MALRLSSSLPKQIPAFASRIVQGSSAQLTEAARKANQVTKATPIGPLPSSHFPLSNHSFTDHVSGETHQKMRQISPISLRKTVLTPMDLQKTLRASQQKKATSEEMKVAQGIESVDPFSSGDVDNSLGNLLSGLTGAEDLSMNGITDELTSQPMDEETLSAPLKRNTDPKALLTAIESLMQQVKEQAPATSAEAVVSQTQTAASGESSRKWRSLSSSTDAAQDPTFAPAPEVIRYDALLTQLDYLDGRIQDYMQGVELNNHRIKRVGQLQQHVRAEGGKGFSWKDSEEKLALIEECKAYGLVVPEGKTEWTDAEANLFLESLSTVADQHTHSIDRHKMYLSWFMNRKGVWTEVLTNLERSHARMQQAIAEKIGSR